MNLEYLGRVVFDRDGYLYPDSLVGTDSHTTMIDGLGVAGWGVGGIEAEAAMLGQVWSSLHFSFAYLKEKAPSLLTNKQNISGIHPVLCKQNAPIS